MWRLSARAVAARDAARDARGRFGIQERTSPRDGNKITEEDESLFTGNACHVLAVELNRATGWPVVVLQDEETEYGIGWVHMAVRTPSGSILDAQGEHDEADWLDHWAEYADAAHEDDPDYDGDDAQVVQVDDLRRVSVDPDDTADGEARPRAMQVAQMLLARHG